MQLFIIIQKKYYTILNLLGILEHSLYPIEGILWYNTPLYFKGIKMTISAELEQKIRSLLRSNLLEEDELDNDQPWGEDGSIYAFEQGQKYGAHDLAEAILTLLDK